MEIICDNNSLKQACNQLCKKDRIAIDTEFMRDKTFFPKLCLIQIYDGEEVYLIDPLKVPLDFSPLIDILIDPRILKIFHSARQDIEIIYNLSSKIPSPIFDTQITAAVCNYGESVSYETLVARILGATIDKSSRVTDWSARPLTKKQIEYAKSDVIHLYHLYEKLNILARESNRNLWVQEEINFLLNAENYKNDPFTAWRKLPLKSSNKNYVKSLFLLAKWREEEAINLNIPRGHLIKDEVLLEIAAHAPKTMEKLLKIRSLNKYKNLNTLQLERIIEIFSNLKNIEVEESLLQVKKPQQNDSALIALLKVLLKAKSEEYGVAEKIIATKEDIINLSHLNDKDFDSDSCKLLHGWRYEIFGKDAKNLIEGNLFLSAKDNKIILIKK